MRRLANISGITFVLYLLWKVTMIIFTAQPVPANDAFFYDGPVVNYLLHGKYCNPALANVLPISGTEVFSAYPPLYQGVLLGWMKCFGTSELAAMWLHVTLLAVFTVTVWQIFNQLKVSAPAMNLAGLFLFGITFNDRPDTLAHALGALALLALVRGWPWATAVFLMLTFGTSLQIGGIYSLWLVLFVLGEAGFAKNKIPWAAVATLIGGLAGLILLVKFGHPRWWEGFREHVAITPSVTGLRLPRVDDVLKIGRAAPGILLVVILLAGMAIKGRAALNRLTTSRDLRFIVSGCLAALALMGGCLFVLTPNTIHITGYLQPVIVGGFLAMMATGDWFGSRRRWLLNGIFLMAVALVSIRAVGMTTWGLLCARDVSRIEALSRINQELDAVPTGGTVFVSAAYLYETAPRTNITWLHSDWASIANENDWELRALQEHRPARLLLTQFDYYRRYERIVSLLQRTRGDVTVRIINTTRVQTPDAERLTQKVVQHIAWAPVIVEFDWPPLGGAK